MNYTLSRRCRYAYGIYKRRCLSDASLSIACEFHSMADVIGEPRHGRRAGRRSLPCLDRLFRRIRRDVLLKREFFLHCSRLAFWHDQRVLRSLDSFHFSNAEWAWPGLHARTRR